MPHEYDESVRKYRFNGRYVSKLELRAEIDKLSIFVAKEAKVIAERYTTGAIDIGSFESEMRALLKAGHIISSSVGRGGRERMTQADWGRVGGKIQRQFRYLSNFARKLEQGKITNPMALNRARSYASSIYVSFANAFKEAQTEFIEGGGNTNPNDEMLCRLVQNSQEGCAECKSDADDGWIPVSEMKEIGDRICGDFCLCTIEFEDEV